MDHQQVPAKSVPASRRSGPGRSGPLRPVVARKASTDLGRLAADLARASESMFAGPTRIQRATRPAASGTPDGAVSSGLVIQRRIDQTFAQFAATQPPANTDGQNTSAYLLHVRDELTRLRAMLPDNKRYLFDGAQGQLAAAVSRARELGRNATAAQLQQFRTDYIEPLVEEVNRVDDALTAEGNAALAAEQQRAQEAAEARDAWAYDAAEYGTTVPPSARADLETLLAHAGGQFYRTKVGTIVGGRFAKSGKRIDGVDASARLDVQAPPKKGLHNVQFQVGDWSYAGVLFATDDGEARIVAELLQSLTRGRVAVSPAYRQRR